MTPEQKLREVKRLSGLTWPQLAEALGYNKATALSDIARGQRGMSGPAETALDYLAQGILDDQMRQMRRVIPEYVMGDNIVVRLWWPRAIITAKPTVMMWIDRPVGFDVDGMLKDIKKRLSASASPTASF